MILSFPKWMHAVKRDVIHAFFGKLEATADLSTRAPVKSRVLRTIREPKTTKT